MRILRREERMKKKKKRDISYAHNPHYCMIMPDARIPDDDIVSTGRS